jgi:hypothetical protein
MKMNTYLAVGLASAALLSPSIVNATVIGLTAPVA